MTMPSKVNYDSEKGKQDTEIDATGEKENQSNNTTATPADTKKAAQSSKKKVNNKKRGVKRL